MDQYKKIFLKDLAEFLGAALGKDYEIIIHAVDKNGENAHVIALVNSNISGRNFDSPLTNLALKMIKNKEYEKYNYKVKYLTTTKTNNDIVGATFFIKDKLGNLEGLLCINHSISNIKRAIVDLLNSLDIPNLLNNKDDKPSSESLSNSIEDIIYSVINPNLINSDIIISPEKKQEIIGKLYQNGVFSMKGAVSTVAKILGISEPTIYRYLKNFK
ncbi:PAS domain-containing protein [Lactobacillus sp. ESL0791]|uniref:helix-turn-helix transcriptional regulator n=1 Tax=Lactobacillus sp. ESL0791 TaxID=2983234 RepID=UPI0023F8F13C|nr:PAS domain-containing protein [Lactobacillus sp. ESL0791]MDF7639663.1 PAS domain-containing protein [Lactobacillus sp. ESL0791]